jgi:hypothetical protein
MIKLLKMHLECVQQRMKTRTNKVRTERNFQVGKEVYLKLQHYLQTSAAKQANNKLSFKSYGPYLIE